MNPRISQLVAAAVVGLVVSSAYAESTAQNDAAEQNATVAAKKLLDEGIARFEKSDLAGARAAFLKAWEIKKHRAIATNLAEVEIRMGMFVLAARRLQELIVSTPADRQDELPGLNAQLDQCRPFVATIRLELNVADAVASVNGELLPVPSQRAELFLQPGEVNLELRKDGYATVARHLSLGLGVAETQTVELVPTHAPLPRPAVAVAPVSSPPAKARWLEPRTIVVASGVVLTLASAVVGTVYWVKSNRTSDRADTIRSYLNERYGDDSCAESSPPDAERCERLHSLNEQFDSERAWMVGTYVGAGVLGVASAATYALWPKRKVPPTAVLGPMSVPAGAGLQWSGSF